MSAWKEHQVVNMDVTIPLEDSCAHVPKVKDFVMMVLLVVPFATLAKMSFPTTSAMKPLSAQLWR